MQKFDYFNLLWQIDRKFSSRAAFCKAANITPGQLKHMQNGEQLTARTIKNAAQALRIPAEEIGFYFSGQQPQPQFDAKTTANT